MGVPLKLGRNEATKTLGLLWNPSSDQFLIIKGTSFQELLLKVLFLLLLQLFLTHWA